MIRASHIRKFPENQTMNITQANQEPSTDGTDEASSFVSFQANDDLDPILAPASPELSSDVYWHRDSLLLDTTPTPSVDDSVREELSSVHESHTGDAFYYSSIFDSTEDCSAFDDDDEEDEDACSVGSGRFFANPNFLPQSPSEQSVESPKMMRRRMFEEPLRLLVTPPGLQKKVFQQKQKKSPVQQSDSQVVTKTTMPSGMVILSVQGADEPIFLPPFCNLDDSRRKTNATETTNLVSGHPSLLIVTQSNGVSVLNVDPVAAEDVTTGADESTTNNSEPVEDSSQNMIEECPLPLETAAFLKDGVEKVSTTKNLEQSLSSIIETTEASESTVNAQLDVQLVVALACQDTKPDVSTENVTPKPLKQVFKSQPEKPTVAKDPDWTALSAKSKSCAASLNEHGNVVLSKTNTAAAQVISPDEILKHKGFLERVEERKPVTWAVPDWVVNSPLKSASKRARPSNIINVNTAPLPFAEPGKILKPTNLSGRKIERKVEAGFLDATKSLKKTNVSTHKDIGWTKPTWVNRPALKKTKLGPAVVKPQVEPSVVADPALEAN